ncbi:MAG: hypothetical protein AAGK02_08070 [Pseudomonadota bacterium]
MSGGKKKSRSKTTTTLNPWTQQQYTQGRNRVTSLLDQPYKGFEGATTATDLADGEKAGRGLIYDSVGSYEPGVAEVRSSLDGVKDFSEFDAATYVNPHADALVESVTGDISENADRARAQIASDTLASKAYGGSRHGVREGLLDETTQDAIADASAGIRYQTWDKGTENFYRDQDNQFRRTGILGDITAAERRFEGEDIERLLNVGSIERAVEDRAKAGEYATHLKEQEDYWRRIQAEMGLLGSVPILTNTDSTNTTKSNPGLLGVVGAGAQIGGSIFGAGGAFGSGGFWGGQ